MRRWVTTVHVRPLEHGPRQVYRVGIYVVLIALGIGIRAWTGPWYHLYNPSDARVIDGIPATWEVVYFAPHIASFTSSTTPNYGFAPVQIRAFIPLSLAAVLTAITNHVGISLFIVEIFGWVLACVATEWLGQQMGMSSVASFCGGILVATSPLFTSQLGMIVLHPAEFASLPVGLVAVLPLLNRITQYDSPSHLRPIRDGTFLGIVFVILSLSYVYHWALIFFVASTLSMLFSRLLMHRVFYLHFIHFTFACAIFAIAVGFFFVISQTIQSAFVVIGLPPLIGEITAVAQPADLALQLFASRGWIEALRSLWNAMPKSFDLTLIAFHPVPLSVGLFGVLRNAQLRYVGLSLLVFSLVSSYVYHAPWTSMSAYPIVYLGAADIATRISHTVVRAHGDVFSRDAASLSTSLGIVCLSVIMLPLILVTNVDLIGNFAFAQRWWQAYWSILPY